MYRFLGHVGPVADAITAVNWSATSLGALPEWSAELRTSVGLLFGTDHPAALWWGPELRLIHNAPYQAEVLRERGSAQGQYFDDVWREVASQLRPQFDQVIATGRGVSFMEQRVDLVRDGRPEEAYWNYSLTPVFGADGGVLGIFNGAREVTDQVLGTKTNALLVGLDDALAESESIERVAAVALELIARQVGAKRAGFAEIDSATRILDVAHLWTTGSMPDIRGRYPLGTFGAIGRELAAGLTVVVDDNLTDPRTADDAVRERYAQINLRAGVVIPIIDHGRYAGGVFVQDDVPRIWSRFEVQLAEAATQRLWSALGRLRAEAALRASEQRYRLIFEQAEDIVFTASVDQVITDCNAAGAKAIGLAREEIIGRSISDFVDSSGFAQTTSMLQHKIDYGGNTRHEVAVTAPDGRQMLWDNNSTLILDPDRKPIGLLSISRDVTERRAFDKRRELLIHELNHRVKNTLSLVQGLAHQSFRAGQDPQDASADFLSRLSALAVAHDLLTREQWEGVTIADVVRGATAHIGPQIEFGGPHLLVSPKSAVALVMALHELTTNAVKYGALSVPSGRTIIDWAQHAGDRFLLTWRESDGPAVEAPSRRGFGVRMIERALASDLGGSVHMDFAPTGVVCTIDGPVLS